MQEPKQNLTTRKSGVTTWATPLSYDFLIVAYCGLLNLHENDHKTPYQNV